MADRNGLISRSPVRKHRAGGSNPPLSASSPLRTTRQQDYSRFDVLSISMSGHAWSLCLPALSHLASAALRALSLRSSSVILLARARPPLSPPRRPSITARGSFPVPSVASITAWSAAYAVWLASGASTPFGRIRAILCFARLARAAGFAVCLRDRFSMPQRGTLSAIQQVGRA